MSELRPWPTALRLFLRSKTVLDNSSSIHFPCGQKFQQQIVGWNPTKCAICERRLIINRVTPDCINQFIEKIPKYIQNWSIIALFSLAWGSKSRLSSGRSRYCRNIICRQKYLSIFIYLLKYYTFISMAVHMLLIFQKKACVWILLIWGISIILIWESIWHCVVIK